MYPETRLRPLTDADIEDLDSDQIRYAINEINARHGLWFTDATLRQRFAQFSWYHPVKNLKLDQVHKLLTPIESANQDLLASRKKKLDKLKGY